MMIGQSQRNKISLSNRLESSCDLCPALESVHEFIQLMQGRLRLVFTNYVAFVNHLQSSLLGVFRGW